MKLNAPKKITWWISTVLAVLGVIGKLVVAPILTVYSWPLILVAFVLLWLATFVKGL